MGWKPMPRFTAWKAVPRGDDMSSARASGKRLLVVLILPLVCGCRQQATVRSNLSIDVGGRRVKATLDRSARISTDKDSAVINFEGRTLVIEKDKVVLDGTRQAQLPPAAKTVEVTYIDDKLSVTADGSPVEIAPG
jgi:hypothetical protein